MNYHQLLAQVKEYVIHLFKTHAAQKLSYHNLEHTESVVSNAGRIAKFYNLADRDVFTVMTAAWFHDTGYLNGGAADHENRGAQIAEQYLTGKNIDPDLVSGVRQCIVATRLPQSPASLKEQIVCDADLFHLGTNEFKEKNRLMRKEMEWRSGKKIDKADWRRSTLRMMESHHYHTGYCQNLLNEKKRQNLEELKSKETDPSLQPAVTTAGIMEPPVSPGKKQEQKKVKIDRPERGIETMFRISSTNHQRLSDMADNKAHIMITTTSIIISVLLSVLLRKLEDNPQLIIPTMILLSVCVTTMVFSILATRPALPPGTFTQQEIETRKVNLLFFGNFYRMSFEDFDSGMKQMMNERDFLYGSLTRDLYSQGKVLGKKYRLLRKGYTVFMYGIVASVIAFFVASVFFK